MQLAVSATCRHVLVTIGYLLLVLSIAPAQSYHVNASFGGSNMISAPAIGSQIAGRHIPATSMANQPPSATITAPAPGAQYHGGEKIRYAGTGTDPESGFLPGSAFTWQVDFHQGTQVTSVIAPTSGTICGAFTIPTTGYARTDAFYRISLTVTDGSLSNATYRDVVPETATLTIATNPPGLQITLDGQPQTAPASADSIVGISRTLGVASPQTIDGKIYQFVSWSDGGAATHSITTPAASTTYTATFQAATEQTKTIVNWGGDYVSTDTAMQRYITLDANIDLDGDNASDDTRGYLPYSDTQPINPYPPGPNAYGTTYATGTSYQFYGGILFQRYNGAFGSKWAEIWDRGTLDHIYESADATSDGWALIYWKKADFLDGASSGTVVFGAGSSLELLNYSGADGVVANNTGRVRFVVRDGAQFYISEAYGDSAAASFTLNDLESKTWALYNPSAPYNLKLNAAGATFAPHTFADITAVGYYHSNDNSTSASRRAGLNLERFRVTADVLPAAGIQLGSGGPAANEQYHVSLPLILNAGPGGSC